MSHPIALIINFGLLLPPANGEANVMFSVVSVHQSVILSTGVGGVPTIQGPANLYNPTVLTHCTEPHWTCSNMFRLDLIVQSPTGPVLTCSGWTSLYRAPLDLFRLIQVEPHCTGTHPPNMFTLAHYVAPTVGKTSGWHSSEMPSCLGCGWG